MWATCCSSVRISIAKCRMMWWPLKPRVGIVRRALNEGVVLETSDGLGPDGAHFGTAFERVERRPELRHHRA